MRDAGRLRLATASGLVVGPALFLVGGAAVARELLRVPDDWLRQRSLTAAITIEASRQMTSSTIM